MSVTPTRGIQVLVVDDEPDLRTLYELALLRDGFGVHTAGTLAEARRQLGRQTFALLLTDMRLPDGLGLELLQEVARAGRPERCIVITAYGSAENAVEALKAGAFDYLTKPVDLKQFRSVVRSALDAPADRGQPAAQVESAPDDGGVPAPATRERSEEPEALARLVGESAAMRDVRARIVKVAATMAPVLICGESGTGKELAAQALHACSHRASGPFVPVNCGAIPENLLEAEFFGARKGSYTGATQDRKGFFQAASGGTLFLDEIGDLPVSMQAKLLRAIQERRIRPIGATREEPVDIRIISATHKNLAAEVQAGHFRHDLFYRLNVIEIMLPPLRDRREDIPAIAAALLARLGAQSGAAALAVQPHQLEQITQAPLRGNVRELENLLQRAAALGDGANLESGNALPQAPSAAAATATPQPEPAPDASAAGSARTHAAPGIASTDLASWLDGQERDALQSVLANSEDTRAQAAAALGLSRRQLDLRLARLTLDRPADDPNHANR